MGWSSRWIIVVSGPAAEVEQFKREYREIFSWYPDGECAAWQRVGLHLQLPFWTLRRCFEREEAEAEAEERRLNGDDSPAALPREDEIPFTSPKAASNVISLKNQVSRLIARDLIASKSISILKQVEELPEELQAEILRWMSESEFESLKNSLGSQRLRYPFPRAELQAQLIYDFCLNKGYQIHEIKKVSSRFRKVFIDVAFWTQSDGEQQVEIRGGGEMGYYLDNPVEFDISYSHELWIRQERDVPSSKGWVQFTKIDIFQPYRFHFDTWNESQTY